MRQINTFNSLNDIVEAAFKKGCLTNNYFLLDAYEKHINAGDLWVIDNGENTMFLLDKKDFYQLYFYLNDLNTPLQFQSEKPVVMEILYRGSNNKPFSLIDYWNKQGFTEHLSRDHMIATSQQIVLPSVGYEDTIVKFATTEIEVDFTKKLFDKELDIYTGDRLSYDELLSFMKKSYLLSAYYKDELAGVLQFEIRNKVVWLGHIAIHSKFRGKGSANALVDSYIILNKMDDHTRYALWVIQDNVPAVNLYRKFGFVYGNKSTVSMLKRW